MSDNDFPTWSAPPPRRPAPEQLRGRIIYDLDRDRRRGRLSRSLVALAAAAVVVVATVFGLTQSRTTRQAIPAASPTVAPSESPETKASSPSSTPTPVAEPTAAALGQARSLSEQQIAQDLASCLASESSDPHATPLPHRGRFHTKFALDVPTIALRPGDSDSLRVLVTQDEVGRITCVNGTETGWSAETGNLRRANSDFPAALQLDSGMGGSCDRQHRTGTWSYESYWDVTDDVAYARVAVSVDGVLASYVELAPTDHRLALAFRLSGAALYREVSWEASFYDSNRHPVRLNIPGNGGAPVTAQSGKVKSCADIGNPTHPDQIEPPASDAAGVKACRDETATHARDAGEDFDAKHAEVALTTSSSTAWGTILSDGGQYVACSRYPTQEIGPLRSTSTAVSAPTFGWAENPIPTGGESLWAAGHTPGLRSLTYVLPGNRRIAARVTADGWWLVMASTTTAFDTEESSSLWEPVRVEVTTEGGTKTFELPWNEKNSCNQVSHGC